MGLTLDESALLLELDDVYWSEEGIVSVQITLGASPRCWPPIALATRFLRRGEQVVLEARPHERRRSRRSAPMEIRGSGPGPGYGPGTARRSPRRRAEPPCRTATPRRSRPAPPPRRRLRRSREPAPARAAAGRRRRPPVPGIGGPVPPGGWQQPLGARRPPSPTGPAGELGLACRGAADRLARAPRSAGSSCRADRRRRGARGGDDDVGHVVALAIVLFMLACSWSALFYAPLLMSAPGTRNGQTWGKQVLGIRSMRDNGEPFDFGAAAHARDRA